MTERLERLGHRVILPQRDGFEFSALHRALGQVLPADQVPGAVQDIIYYLDMGHFLPQAQVVVANLDEPVDEGVVVEISYAKLANKGVIGIRSDVRTPFGAEPPRGNGLHFFPAHQCHTLILQRQPNASPALAQAALEALAQGIHNASQGIPGSVPSATPDPMADLQAKAKALFHDLEDLHAPKALATIASRYGQLAPEFAAFKPRRTVL